MKKRPPKQAAEGLLTLSPDVLLAVIWEPKDGEQVETVVPSPHPWPTNLLETTPRHRVAAVTIAAMKVHEVCNSEGRTVVSMKDYTVLVMDGPRCRIGLARLDGGPAGKSINRAARSIVGRPRDFQRDARGARQPVAQAT